MKRRRRCRSALACPAGGDQAQHHGDGRSTKDLGWVHRAPLLSEGSSGYNKSRPSTPWTPGMAVRFGWTGARSATFGYTSVNRHRDAVRGSPVSSHDSQTTPVPSLRRQLRSVQVWHRDLNPCGVDGMPRTGSQLAAGFVGPKADLPYQPARRVGLERGSGRLGESPAPPTRPAA